MFGNKNLPFGMIFILAILVCSLLLTSCTEDLGTKTLSTDSDIFKQAGSELSSETSGEDINLLDLFSDSNMTRKETKLGESTNFDGKNSIFDKFKAKLRLDNVSYGDEAMSTVKNAHKNNPQPVDGFEYIIAEFSIKVENVYGDGKTCNINPANFSLVDANGKEYPSVLGIKNIESKGKDLRAGSNIKMKVLFQKEKKDPTVRILFLERNQEAPYFIFDIPGRNNGEEMEETEVSTTLDSAQNEEIVTDGSSEMGELSDSQIETESDETETAKNELSDVRE